MIRKCEIVEFQLTTLKRLKVEHGLLSTQMVNAPWQFFQWDLEQRANFLGAPSAEALCKTMIMENYKYQEECKDDPYYPRFVVVIVQFCRQISSQKVLNVAKRYQNSFYEKEPSKKIAIKGHKFRLASNEAMAELSGYRFNAVFPFFMKNETLPIILDASITELDPQYFWFGGGRVSLKTGTSIEDFKKYAGSRLIID